ncbi:glycosyltransferase [Glaciihabitans sp. dw_435]|uniref:glycosyltransferase n=1 Tax=Glaciihabitans sp. dw_435 TaxID=2720081 RepID=UPI001BD1C5BC|nr:glycosyltransferase [Glaciihabitans sp. dw_435]
MNDSPQRRKRLIVLASTFPVTQTDGVPAFVLDIAREEAEEFDVTVLTPSVPGAPLHQEIDGVRVVRFRYFPSRWEDLADGAILDNLKARRSRWLQVLPLLVAQGLALRSLVRSTRPDALHAHWVIPQGIVAAVAAPRVPTLITTHGGDIYALNNPLINLVKKWVLRRAASVSTVNAEMAGTLTRWGVPAKNLHLLPMGVQLDDVLIARAETEPQIDHVVMVGRLVEKKGMGVMIDALRRHMTTKDCTVSIIGDGPLREQLERQSRGWRVSFLGQLGRPDVLREMGRSSVFVVPSIAAASGDKEGLPVVLLEAAAMGAAIVASDIPGINEAMRHGETALLVPQGDAEALAAAIDSLLQSAPLRGRLGAAAAQRAKDYSVSHIGAQYRDVIRGIMDDRATR